MPPRQRTRSSRQRARARPGVAGACASGGGEGRAATRQRVTAAFGSANAGSAAWRNRRRAKAMTPEPSAASCSLREAVSPSRPTSPTTPARPGWRSASSITSSPPRPASANTTRSGCRPAAARGGGEQVMPHNRPQHGPAPLGQQPGQQQRRGCPVLHVRPVPRHLVQRPDQQATAGQMPVNARDTKAQHASPGTRTPQACDAGAQCIQGGAGGDFEALVLCGTYREHCLCWEGNPILLPNQSEESCIDSERWICFLSSHMRLDG